MKKSTKKNDELPAGVSVGSFDRSRSVIVRIVLILTVLIVIAAVFFAVRRSIEARSVVCTPNSSIYNEASGALGTQNFEALESTVTKMKKDKTFKKTVDCLYPVLEHAMIQKDNSAVKQYLNDFKRVAKTQKNLAQPYHANGVKTSNDVIQKVEAFLSEQNKFDSSTVYF